MRRPKSLEKMKSKLKPGHVYRRSDFTSLSSNVDRNLAKLVEDGVLNKIQNGLYFSPKKSSFGDSFPNENELLAKFLNDDHFVVYGPSLFNSLGLGTTQLYNRKVVFNRKRHGEIELAGRLYYFYKWREAPKELSKEFLLVELMNKFNELAEDREGILENLKKKFQEFDIRKLKYSLKHYGTLSAQKRLEQLIYTMKS